MNGKLQSFTVGLTAAALLPSTGAAAASCSVDVSITTVSATSVNEASVFEWYVDRQHEIVFLNATFDYSIPPNPADRIDQGMFALADDESDGEFLRSSTFPVPTVRPDPGRYAENYVRFRRDGELRMNTASMGMRWSDLVGFYQIDLMSHSNSTRIVELRQIPPGDIASYGACMKKAKAERAATR